VVGLDSSVFLMYLSGQFSFTVDIGIQNYIPYSVALYLTETGILSMSLVVKST
jgi:hypothetical protein